MWRKRARRELRTFPSARPLVQIDHIFVSAHFAVEDIATVRNDLSRVASDHLPLVASLRLEELG